MSVDQLLKELGPIDAYDWLGLEPSASDAQIKKRARYLLGRVTHPDHAHSDPEAKADMQRLFLRYAAARDLLMEHRAEYDRRRTDARTGGPHTAGPSPQPSSTVPGSQHRERTRPRNNARTGQQTAPSYGSHDRDRSPHGAYEEGQPYGNRGHGEGTPYGRPPWTEPSSPRAGQVPARNWGGPPGARVSRAAVMALALAFLASPFGLILGFLVRARCQREGLGGRDLATAAILVSLANLALVIFLTTGAGSENSSPAELSAAQVEAHVAAEGGGRITAVRCQRLPLEVDARSPCSARVDRRNATVTVTVLGLPERARPVLGVTVS